VKYMSLLHLFGAMYILHSCFVYSLPTLKLHLKNEKDVPSDWSKDRAVMFVTLVWFCFCCDVHMRFFASVKIENSCCALSETCYSVHDVQLFTVLTCNWFLCFSGVCLCSLIRQGTGMSSSLYPLHGEVRYLWGDWAFVVVSSSLGLMSVVWLQQNYKGCYVFGFNLLSLPTYVGCSPLLLWHAGIPHLPLDTGQGQDLGVLQGAPWVSFLLILAVRLLIASSLFCVQSLIWEALYWWPWICLITCWWALSVAMGLGF
jgi:hypothetical protein